MTPRAPLSCAALVACLALDGTAAGQVPGWSNPFQSLLRSPPRLDVRPGFSLLACCASVRTLDARLRWPADDNDGTGAALVLTAGVTASGGRSYRRAGAGGVVSGGAGPLTITGSATASAGSGAGPQQVYSVELGAGLADLALDVRTTWFGDSRADSVYFGGVPSLAGPVPSGNYTDGELTARHGFGRARVRLTGGMRFGGRPDDTAEWLWSEAEVPLTHGLSVALAAGVRPDRAELAQPGGRFTQLTVRFGVGPASSDPQGVLPAPEPPPFSIAALARNRYRLRLRIERARSVEMKGDVTDWRSVPLRPAADAAGIWEVVLETAPGLYHVNFRVDGGPWYVPDGFPALPDGFGGVTGLLTLQPFEEDHHAES